jgi:tetratricopeptide (TPR) repeat protein
VNYLIKNGINLISRQEYEQAYENFKVLDKEFAGLPVGKIYLAASKIAQNYDYAIPFDENYILENLEAAETQSEYLLKSNPENIWYHYFAGLAKGYLAYYKALNGNWLDAITGGFEAVSHFEDCLKINPDFYEAMIAIGAYKYWKSRKTEFISWLPFIDDEKEEGILMLKKAVEKSTYNSYLAVNSLIWIYIDNKDYKKAAKIAENALKNFPTNRSFKWGLARSNENIDKRKSILIYYDILKSFPVKSNINQITLKHLIAQQYEKIGETQKAMKLCNEIFSVKNLSDFEKEKLGDRLSRVAEMKKRLSAK